MYISADTLDDVLRRVIGKLLKSKNRIRTSRGWTREIFGVLLQVTHPRARLSRTEKKGTLFSCLGELLWYLAKTNDLGFINYYAPEYQADSDDGQTIRGAYGIRLFNMGGNDQVANVLRLLREVPNSRRAVIQLFDASDIAKHYKAIPCTCTMQFTVRRKRLDMLTSMRSNDVFLGLPHDVFAFTMLQELLARALNITLGTYKHAVGSLHIYEKHIQSARVYLREGWQREVSMPRMPVGDPWPSVKALLNAERELRDGRPIEASKLRIHPYWADLVRLLEIYRHFRNDDREKIGPLKSLITSRVYDPYIDRKRQNPPRRASGIHTAPQLSLF